MKKEKTSFIYCLIFAGLIMYCGIQFLLSNVFDGVSGIPQNGFEMLFTEIPRWIVVTSIILINIIVYWGYSYFRQELLKKTPPL